MSPVPSRTAFPLHFIKHLIALSRKPAQTPDLESCSWMRVCMTPEHWADGSSGTALRGAKQGSSRVLNFPAIVSVSELNKKKNKSSWCKSDSVLLLWAWRVAGGVVDKNWLQILLTFLFGETGQDACCCKVSFKDNEAHLSSAACRLCVFMNFPRHGE